MDLSAEEQRAQAWTDDALDRLAEATSLCVTEEQAGQCAAAARASAPPDWLWVRGFGMGMPSNKFLFMSDPAFGTRQFNQTLDRRLQTRVEDEQALVGVLSARLERLKAELLRKDAEGRAQMLTDVLGPPRRYCRSC